MNNIDTLVLLLPILFIIHDFEEIVMAEVWEKRYKEKISKVWSPKKIPFGLNYMQNCKTAAINLGVLGQFLFIAFVCLLSVFFQNYILWYGFMIGFTLHLVTLHVKVIIDFKKYVPGILTAPIVLIPCLWIIFKAHSILQYDIITVFLSTIFIMFANGIFTFKVLHKKTGPWSEWLYKYSQKENV